MRFLSTTCPTGSDTLNSTHATIKEKPSYPQRLYLVERRKIIINKNMETLISLLVVVAVVSVAIWLVRLIKWPEGLEIIGTIVTIIIVIMGLVSVLSML